MARRDKKYPAMT